MLLENRHEPLSTVRVVCRFIRACVQCVVFATANRPTVPATRNLCAGKTEMLSACFFLQDMVLLWSSDSFLTGGNVGGESYMKL